MLRVDAGDWLAVPTRCPECSAKLYVEIEEWDAETGKVTECGFHLCCTNEDFEDRDTWHRHWQSEWQPAISKVRRWLDRNVRVRLEE